MKLVQMRLRLHAAARAEVQSLASSSDDDLARASRDIDDLYRALDELLGTDGATGHELGDAVAQLAVLARTRTMREVSHLLAMFAMNDDAAGHWTYSRTPKPLVLDDDEGDGTP